MALDLLVCPACRKLTGAQLDVRTLEPSGEVLACVCGRRYPVVDGVPIVLKEAGPYLRDQMVSVVERDLPPEVAGLLAEDGPDDEPYARMLEHLSFYLDGHWGDCALPVSQPGFALGPLIERLDARPPVELAIDLGCSVGRVLAHLRAERVIGIDLDVAALRRARKLLAGEPLDYARRMIGRHYAPATIKPRKAVEHVKVVCSDVLDPPVLPEVFDRVVALNVLDIVAHPRQLLTVMDGLCAPGGELILSSPYQWQSTALAEHERFGGADPAVALVGMLRAGTDLRRPYAIEDEADLTWTLRRDARSSVSYRTHYVRARKPSS